MEDFYLTTTDEGVFRLHVQKKKVANPAAFMDKLDTIEGINTNGYHTEQFSVPANVITNPFIYVEPYIVFEMEVDCAIIQTANELLNVIMSKMGKVLLNRELCTTDCVFYINGNCPYLDKDYKDKCMRYIEYYG